MFWVISMHYITLFVIHIDDIRCLEPFLSLYDHFEIWRFLGPNWQYELKPCPRVVFSFMEYKADGQLR